MLLTGIKPVVYGRPAWTIWKRAFKSRDTAKAFPGPCGEERDACEPAGPRPPADVRSPGIPFPW